jgi:hypothetical protein
MTDLRPEWRNLRELVWDWDPIGIGERAREFTEDEYECILERVVPLLQSGASVVEIAWSLDEFLPNHFGMRAQHEAASVFAGNAVALWSWYGGPTQQREGLR